MSESEEQSLGKEMTFLEHLNELRIRVTRILATIGIIAVISFSFGIQKFEIFGITLYLPYPTVFDNISSQILSKAAHDLLPNYVEIIQIAPGQAIIAQLYVSVFLGLLFGMPIIIREIWAFVSPALYPHEKKTIAHLTIPASLLFALGAYFSYVYVTPLGIDFLYKYGVAVGAKTFVTIEDFISFTLLFLVGLGLAFQLPIIMWFITRLGIVEPRFWWENFRYSFVAMVIFGAVITPDGSGITMWLVAGPMIGLYLGTYLLLRFKMKGIQS
ncbi:MAG: twin-arginine translocase subunit TatC [Nitrososphaerales archaeon]